MPENKSTVLKQVTSVLLETGIQMLKIVKDLNENDQLYKKQENTQTEKGAKKLVAIFFALIAWLYLFLTQPKY